jgi:hypothetical protein
MLENALVTNPGFKAGGRGDGFSLEINILTHFKRYKAYKILGP